jgi:hypothetical protein
MVQTAMVVTAHEDDQLSPVGNSLSDLIHPKTERIRTWYSSNYSVVAVVEEDQSFLRGILVLQTCMQIVVDNRKIVGPISAIKTSQFVELRSQEYIPHRFQSVLLFVMYIIYLYIVTIYVFDCLHWQSCQWF